MHRERGGDVVCADALTFLHSLKSSSADIVFLDPPFNLGKTYPSRAKHKDQLEVTEYTTYMHQILLRAADVLKPGGALYLYHIPRFALIFGSFLHNTLQFRHWIAIAMKNGFVRGTHLYPAHYALLYFTKGDPAVFQRPKVSPPRCKKCKAPLRDYGGYKRFVIDGVNLSDYWDDISPVRHRKYKMRRANELPLLLPQRAVQISGRRNGLLVDPFAGTGTAALAARAQGMRFVVSDAALAACRTAARRLNTNHGARSTS